MRTSLVTAALLLAAPLHALPYRVELQTPMEGVTAILHARQIDGSGEPIRRELTLPASGTLPDAEGTWELRLESEKVWAAPVYSKRSDATGAAVLVAVSAAQVRTRVATDTALPAEVAVFLTPAQVALQGERVRIDAVCPVRERDVICTVPPGTWDLQFSPQGFIPQYRWNVKLTAGRSTTVEPISLIKGAAVVGTVTRVDRSLALPPDTVVRLVPSTMAPQDARSVSYAAKPNAKGFFQIASVPPGEYFLTASSKSLTSDSQQIVIVANRTAELRYPLVIDTPRRLRVTVTPKTDPAGEPWLVSLAVERPGAHILDPHSTSKVDAEGAWEQKGLRDGDYLVTVERQGGAQWASHRITLVGGDMILPILVPALDVEGTITYGDQPIAARVTIGGEFGPRRQMLTADEEGKFAGVIPEPEGDAWDVYIEAETPPLRITLHDVRGERVPDEQRVRLDLELPRTAVPGNVVRQDGTPVEYPIVSIRNVQTGAIDQVSGQKDGAFQISGMAPGPYEILATDFLRRSEIARYDIREDENTPLKLVVSDDQQVRGRVVTANGVPVIGASVLALPANGSSMSMGGPTSTDEHGKFVMPLAPSISSMDVLIAAPGFATIIGRTPVRPDRSMELTVDQHGGALMAEVPANGGGWLAHEGGRWPIQLIAHYAAGSVEDLPKSRRITLPSLQAGEYTLCYLEKCSSGYVPPHGSLELSVK